MTACPECGAAGCPDCGRPHDTYFGGQRRCARRIETVRYHRRFSIEVRDRPTYPVTIELLVTQREDGSWDATIYQPEYAHIPQLEVGRVVFFGIAPNRQRAEGLARDAASGIVRREAAADSPVDIGP